MRVLGFIFLCLIIATALVTGDYYFPGTYLSNFLNNHFIETFAALVGFNIAAVVFLVGQLIGLEEKYHAELASTRREIKHNAYFLLSSFLASLFLLIIRPDLNVSPSFVSNIYYYLDNIFVLTTFGLAIFSIFEILHAVFLLSRTDSKIL